MKENPVLNKIDSKFISAVDELIAINTELGIKPANDSAIGKAVYPNNRSIISAVRGKSKHIPHLALINFAKEFDVNMNYFYSDDESLHYKPNTIMNITVSGNAISSTGNNTTNIHAGKGEIKGINTAEAGSKNTLVEVVEVNTMINNFISHIDKERVQQFFKIITSIQSESKKTTKKFEKLFELKSIEMKDMRKYFEDKIEMMETQLNETREKLDVAMTREIDLLRQLLKTKDE
jgi:hypothetical protein